MPRHPAAFAVIGTKRDLLVDVHNHFNRESGLHLAERLAPLNLFWLEEVTPAKPLSDLAALNDAAKMPTAGGELIDGVCRAYIPTLPRKRWTS